VKVLFVHQNFPGQFRFVAPALAQAGHQVVALHVNRCEPLPGVRSVPYVIAGRSSAHIHPWVADLETKTIRAQAAWQAATRLQQEGFEPDVIVAHPGWGESLFLKQVWPRARVGLYCEFYYLLQGADTHFDPEFARPSPDDGCRLQMKNANNELNLLRADAGLAPTKWQAASFPQPFASRISVIHDGIDTDRVVPDAAATLGLRTAKGNLVLSRSDEVITFVNRNLEPYRGYHIFMRALPAILAARPNARVLIIGGDGVSYGAPPAPDAQGRPTTWKKIFLDEVAGRVDMGRVHFLGRVPYRDYLSVLQVSSVHVYLTYPFVLSWSLLEAMSAGCAIVGSATAPVQEVIAEGHTGRLFDFFSAQALAERVVELCEDRPQAWRLGQQAREVVREGYDLRRICLPQHMAWVDQLADSLGN
jgi:glycosyltransferase involved in cell wall biosynthesis